MPLGLFNFPNVDTKLPTDISDSMRRNAAWMTLADERILEYLDEEGNHQPSQIAKEFPFHRKYLGKRCRKLARNGFLTNRGNGVYQITDRGRDYLRGEFDARNLEDADDKQQPA